MAMNKIWNERETNIDQVINSTAAMYGKMKGDSWAEYRGY